MSYMNLTIVGNCGQDCELRYLPNGTEITTFPVAVNRKFTKDGETKSEVTWIRVTAFSKLALNCAEYVKKGMLILAEGILSPDEVGNPRIWKDQQGNPRASFEMKANRIVFLSRVNETEE